MKMKQILFVLMVAAFASCEKGTQQADKPEPDSAPMLLTCAPATFASYCNSL